MTEHSSYMKISYLEFNIRDILPLQAGFVTFPVTFYVVGMGLMRYSMHIYEFYCSATCVICDS